MDSQEEAQSEITFKKWVMIITIVISAPCGVFGIIDGEILIGAIGFGFAFVAVIALFALRKMSQDITDYHPGKGFGFFRKSKKSKLKILTFWQYGIAVILLLCYYFGMSIGYAFIYGVSGILFIQFYIKRRISLHTKIDDASLFELEEIGIITSKDIVKAIYKDFESWYEVEEENKIFIVTQDSLVCVTMENREDAVRMECKLKNIRKLGVIGHGKRGEGLIISVGTSDNRIIRLLLEGDSSQDSPEEFFRYFLQALDEALTSTPHPVKQRSNTIEQLRRDASGGNGVAVNNVLKPRLNIRQLDIFEPEPSNSGTRPVSSKERYLDL